MPRYFHLTYQIPTSETQFYNCKHLNICIYLFNTACRCNPEGAVEEKGFLKCDDHGHCQCLTNIGGTKCDKCIANHFSFPNCEGTIYLCSISLTIICPAMYTFYFVKQLYVENI